MRIALDAMGGDHAPKAVVEGAMAAAKKWIDTEIILIGNESEIVPLLTEKSDRIRIHHTEEYISAEDEPVRAIRRKKDASMVIAAKMVKDKEVDAMISAGNTGALMTAGLLIVGRMEGVERPALTADFPTMDGKGVLVLDVGANMDATPEQLRQYAIMGKIYAEKMRGIAQPRVGLLNVGTEEKKGNALTKSAFSVLQEAPIHFVGNVEARDVLQGVCDVLVCDGFVGNVLLKSTEGTAGAMFEKMRTVFTASLTSKLATLMLRPGLRRMKKELDYSERGGVPLLGLNGVCMKAHGSSNATAFYNAIRQARDTVQNQIIPSIIGEISGE
jgi:glycerol-3-phosphate acyltransferase PlsX